MKPDNNIEIEFTAEIHRLSLFHLMRMLSNRNNIIIPNNIPQKRYVNINIFFTIISLKTSRKNKPIFIRIQLMLLKNKV